MVRLKGISMLFLAAVSSLSLAQTTIPPVPPTSCSPLAYYVTIYADWGNGPSYNDSTCRWKGSESVSACPYGPGVCSCANATHCYALARVDNVNCTNQVQPNPSLPMDPGCPNTPGPLWQSDFFGPECGGPPMLASQKVDVTHGGQAKDDEAERDIPRPAPSSTLTITDVGRATSPVKIYGTGYSYVKRFPNGDVLIWVEELDLHAQNLSSKTITAMDLELQSVDVGGQTIKTTHKLVFENTTTSRPPLKPGETWNQPWNHVPGPRSRYTAEEYDRLTKMVPAMTGHARSVSFSDGTKYREEESKAVAAKPSGDQR